MFKTHISENLVIHTGVSKVTLDEILTTMRAWFSNPEFDPDKPVLWDLREAQLEPSVEQLEAWGQSMVKFTNENRAGRKTAWVLPTSAVAQTAVDLLSTYNAQNKVRIYHNDFEAAHSWLTTTIR